MIDNISWLAVYPEIILMVMGCVIVLADLGVSSFRRTGTYVLTMLTLAVVAIMQAMYAANGNTVYGWSNMFVSDAMQRPSSSRTRGWETFRRCSPRPSKSPKATPR